MTDVSGLAEKKILVTGSTGLIGSTLINALLGINDTSDTGMQLTLLVRNEGKALERLGNVCTRADVELLVGDVCDGNVIDGGEWDFIVHGAGNAHPLAFSQYPVETMRANLIGTDNLLAHARKQAETGTPVQKFIFFSSGEVYGEAVQETNEGWSEVTPGTVDSMKDRSCYPESKRAAETLCRSYYTEYGVPTVVARLSYIYGANVPDENSRADAQFIRKAAAGQDIVMKSKGEQLRSYCYAKDAVRAIMTLMIQGEPGEVYNVADRGSVMTIREFAQTMADVFHVGLVFDLPKEAEKAGYSQMKREVLNPQKLYDLGWTPEYTMVEALSDIKKELTNLR